MAPEFAGSGETVLLRRLVALCNHMSALSSQVTELGPILDVLAGGIGCGVAVVDRTLEVLAGAEMKETFDDDAVYQAVLTAAARGRRPLAVPGGAAVVAPVLVGGDVAGYLLTVSGLDADFTEDMRLLAIEHAAMVCGLVMGRDLVVTAAAGRARHELLEALLLSSDRNDPELERWARHLGLDPAGAYVVVVFDAPGSRPGSGPVPVEPLLARAAPGTVVAARTDEVVAIVAGSVETARTLATSCLESSLLAGAGVGNPCESAAGVARSYAEARRALAAGQRLAQAATVFADLGIHRLLLRVPDVSDLRAFAEEVLGGLSGEYVETLAVYFRENGSPARAAQQLNVHPNTVGYRIRRVEELTGLSFARHRDRLMAEVAVEILQALGDRS
jgi:PucR C-terminal helix-turn-helix domain/GGDEF-like domain